MACVSIKNLSQFNIRKTFMEWNGFWDIVFTWRLFPIQLPENSSMKIDGLMKSSECLSIPLTLLIWYLFIDSHNQSERSFFTNNKNMRRAFDFQPFSCISIEGEGNWQLWLDIYCWLFLLAWIHRVWVVFAKYPITKVLPTIYWVISRDMGIYDEDCKIIETKLLLRCYYRGNS